MFEGVADRRKDAHVELFQKIDAYNTFLLSTLHIVGFFLFCFASLFLSPDTSLCVFSYSVSPIISVLFSCEPCLISYFQLGLNIFPETYSWLESCLWVSLYLSYSSCLILPVLCWFVAFLAHPFTVGLGLKSGKGFLSSRELTHLE